MEIRDKIIVIGGGFAGLQFAKKLNGNRTNPSRDRVIALCIACHMNLTDTNRALKTAGLSPLYSKVSRDAAIIIMINKCEYDIGIINEFLYGHNLNILSTSSNKEA